VYNYNYLAENIIVYVVDTGIYNDPNHFQDRVKDGISFVSGDPSVLDCNGHGTHVSSIIASTYYGVAKNVTIVPVRIFGCEGGTAVSTVIKAINWILQQNSTKSPTKAVINMSNSGGYSEVLNNAMQAAFNAGFVVVAAAGNDDHNSCLNSPASTKSIITVGCYNKTGQVCSFSNQGPCVDIFAPGELILGLFPDSVPLVISGTSMSAPHVSGVIAIMMSVYKNKTPAQLRNILVGIASAGKLSGFAIKNTVNLKLLSLQSKLCQYGIVECKKNNICLWNRKSRYCYLKF
jgi:subtilisin family serine protease